MTNTNTDLAFVIECGKGINFNVTGDMLATLSQHSEAFHHVLMIGLKNMVQDSHASIVREDFETDEDWRAAKRAKAELKLGAIIAGDVRVSTTPRQPKLSDFDAFARKWIIAKVKAKIGTADWKAKTEGESGAAFIAGLVEKNLAKMDSAIREDWKEELAKIERAKSLSADIEI